MENMGFSGGWRANAVNCPCGIYVYDRGVEERPKQTGTCILHPDRPGQAFTFTQGGPGFTMSCSSQKVSCLTWPFCALRRHERCSDPVSCCRKAKRVRFVVQTRDCVSGSYDSVFTPKCAQVRDVSAHADPAACEDSLRQFLEREVAPCLRPGRRVEPSLA